MLYKNLIVCLFIYLQGSVSVCLILATADFTLVLRIKPNYLAISLGTFLHDCIEI